MVFVCVTCRIELMANFTHQVIVVVKTWKSGLRVNMFVQVGQTKVFGISRQFCASGCILWQIFFDSTLSLVLLWNSRTLGENFAIRRRWHLLTFRRNRQPTLSFMRQNLFFLHCLFSLILAFWRSCQLRTFSDVRIHLAFVREVCQTQIISLIIFGGRIFVILQQNEKQRRQIIGQKWIPGLKLEQLTCRNLSNFVQEHELKAEKRYQSSTLPLWNVWNFAYVQVLQRQPGLLLNLFETNFGINVDIRVQSGKVASSYGIPDCDKASLIVYFCNVNKFLPLRLLKLVFY